MEGNRTIICGPITQSSDPEVVAVSRIAVFGIEDNGEGKNALPDRITTVPKKVVFRDELSKSLVGKILRRELAKERGG